MEKINIAELLKDCPRGMKLDCTIFEGVVFHDVVDRHFPIRVRREQGGLIELTANGCIKDKIDAKCVIFPKGKTTWEGFVPPCQFKDGDIVATDSGWWLGIIKNKHDPEYYTVHCALDSTFNDFHTKGEYCFSRFATEEEKQKLFDTIKANGYKWNSETKTLEKLIESEFKNGDVIVCENKYCTFISIFKENTPKRNNFRGHCVFILEDSEFKVKDSASYFNEVRFATKREKELLFRAIEKNGYKWNEETKTLEKLIEPKFKAGDRIKRKGDTRLATIKDIRDDYYIITILDLFNNAYITDRLLFINQNEYEIVPDKFDINTLKPFDKVLVRCGSFDRWRIQFFEKYDETDKYPFICMWNNKYNQCIPYEGNENLLGTNDDCDEYFRTW